MKSLLVSCGLVFALVSAGVATGQERPATAAAATHLAAGWEPLTFLVGDWEGTGSGAPGASSPSP